MNEFQWEKKFTCCSFKTFWILNQETRRKLSLSFMFFYLLSLLLCTGSRPCLVMITIQTENRGEFEFYYFHIIFKIDFPFLFPSGNLFLSFHYDLIFLTLLDVFCFYFTSSYNSTLGTKKFRFFLCDENFGYYFAFFPTLLFRYLSMSF